MQNGVIQRVREILDKYNLSVSSLAKKIGVVQATLNRQLTGENSISLDTVYAILYYYKEISAEWLLRGEGEMIKGERVFEKEDEEIEVTFYINKDGFLKLKR